MYAGLNTQVFTKGRWLQKGGKHRKDHARQYERNTTCPPGLQTPRRAPRPSYHGPPHGAPSPPRSTNSESQHTPKPRSRALSLVCLSQFLFLYSQGCWFTRAGLSQTPRYNKSPPSFIKETHIYVNMNMYTSLYQSSPPN